MKSNHHSRLFSVLSMVALATACAEGVESESGAVSEAQQAVTLEGDAAPTIASKAKESQLAGTLGSCSLTTSGSDFNVVVPVPAGYSASCTTLGHTTLDTVLAVVENATGSSYPPNVPRNPCSSPYTTEISYRAAAFNDDSAGTVQSTVTWANNDFGSTVNYRMFGFLYSGSNGGSITVSCTFTRSGQPTTTASYSGNFSSGSCRAYPTDPATPTITATGGDTTLLAIADPISNQNHRFNDDCNVTPVPPNVASPGSCIHSMTTNYKTWFTDLCGYGASTASPRTTTVNF